VIKVVPPAAIGEQFKEPADTAWKSVRQHLVLACRYGHCSGGRGISACPYGAWPSNGARVVFAFRSELDTWLRTRSKGGEALMGDEHFRVMFINSPLPTLVLDNARRILDVNAALCEMWGFPHSQFVGRITDAFSQDKIEYDEEEWSKFLLAGASVGQGNVRHSTGTLLGVQYAVKSVCSGLNMVAVVATRPGDLRRLDFTCACGVRRRILGRGVSRPVQQSCRVTLCHNFMSFDFFFRTVVR